MPGIGNALLPGIGNALLPGIGKALPGIGNALLPGIGKALPGMGKAAKAVASTRTEIFNMPLRMDLLPLQLIWKYTASVPQKAHGVYNKSTENCENYGRKTFSRKCSVMEITHSGEKSRKNAP